MSPKSLRTYRLELDFRRAVRRVPRRDRPGLRHWLRTQAEPHSAGRHQARTFYELDPATGHWRRL